MRSIFTLTDEQYDRLMRACQPMRYIVAGGKEPTSPQENANAVWRALGDEMGFVWDTAQPVAGATDRTFSAEVAIKGE